MTKELLKQVGKAVKQGVINKELETSKIKARIGIFSEFFLFIIVTTLIGYHLITFNIVGILFWIGIMILQKLFAKRSPKFLSLSKKLFDPSLFFKKHERIYDGEVPENGVLFTHHPHSVWSFGIIFSMNVGNDPYSTMHLLGSRFALNYPVFGAILRAWGFASVDGKNMNKLMERRANLGLVPGGYQQATLTHHNKYRLFIKKRKGFIKMALKNGYKICPVLVMNEHKMYKHTDFGLKLRLLINKLKFPATVFWGKYGPLPDWNLDVYNVIGTPIDLPHIDKPKVQDIKKWHLHYIETVTQLYEKYKHLNGNIPLQIC